MTDHMNAHLYPSMSMEPVPSAMAAAAAPDYLSHLYPPSIVHMSKEFALPEPDFDSPLSSAPGSPTRSSSSSIASPSRVAGRGGRSDGYASSSPEDAIRTAPSMKLSEVMITQGASYSTLPSKPYYMQKDDEKKEEDAPDDERMGGNRSMAAVVPASTQTQPPLMYMSNMMRNGAVASGSDVVTPPMPASHKHKTPSSSDRLLQARRIIEKSQGMKLPHLVPRDNDDDDIEEPPQIGSRRQAPSSSYTHTHTHTRTHDVDDMSEPGALPSPSKRFQGLSVRTTEALVASNRYQLPKTASPPGNSANRSNNVITPEHGVSVRRQRKESQQGNNVQRGFIASTRDELMGGSDSEDRAVVVSASNTNTKNTNVNNDVAKEDSSSLRSGEGSIVRRRTSELLARYATSSKSNGQQADAAAPSSPSKHSPSRNRKDASSLRVKPQSRRATNKQQTSSEWFSLDSSKAISTMGGAASDTDEIMGTTSATMPSLTSKYTNSLSRPPQGFSPDRSAISNDSSNPYYDDDDGGNTANDDGKQIAAHQEQAATERIVAHPEAPSNVVSNETSDEMDQYDDEYNNDSNDDMPDDERPRSRTTSSEHHHSIKDPITVRSDADAFEGTSLIQKYVTASTTTESASMMHDEDINHLVTNVASNEMPSMDGSSLGGTFDNDSYQSGSDPGKIVSTANSSIVSGMTASTTNWVEYLGHRRAGSKQLTATLSRDSKNETNALSAAIAEDSAHNSQQDSNSAEFGVPTEPIPSRPAQGKTATQPTTSSAPTYREMTPKKDLLSSENSAWWLQEEFSRRSIIKKEINDAILARHVDPRAIQHANDGPSAQHNPQSSIAHTGTHGIPMAARKHQARPPLPNSVPPREDIVAKFATELSNALHSLPQDNSMASMDDSEIAAYNEGEKEPFSGAADTSGPSDVVRRLSYSAGLEKEKHSEGATTVAAHISTRHAGMPTHADKTIAMPGATTASQAPAAPMPYTHEKSGLVNDDPLADANVTAEMKKFASDTRAALRGTIGLDSAAANMPTIPTTQRVTQAGPSVGAATAASSSLQVNDRMMTSGAQSPFRSIAVSQSNGGVEAIMAQNTSRPNPEHRLVQPMPGNRPTTSNSSSSSTHNSTHIDRPKYIQQRDKSAASASTVKSARSEAQEAIDPNAVPVLIDTMDSVLGIPKGDMTLSLLNEDSLPTEQTEKAAWAGRVQDSVWRCRHMRRHLGGLGGKKSKSTPGSPAKRSSLPVDLDKGRVAGGFRSVGSTQEAALQHLKHDEIDEALELYEDIIFAYYAYFEKSLKARETNPGAQDPGQAIDFKPYLGVALHNLGVLNLLNGDCAEALSFFARAVENRRKCLGEGHREHVASLVKHAICLYALHEFAGAHAELELALRLSRGNCNSMEDRMQMAEILNNLGCLLYMCGQPMPSKAYFKESLDIQFELLGESLYCEASQLGHSISLSISITRANIGFVKMVTNDLSVAITALEAALMEQQLLLDGPHDTLIATMEHLAVANMLDGKHEKAACMFGRILQLQYGAYGPHDPRCYVTMEKIKMVQNRGKDFEIAIGELRKTFSAPTMSAFQGPPVPSNGGGAVAAQFEERSSPRAPKSQHQQQPLASSQTHKKQAAQHPKKSQRSAAGSSRQQKQGRGGKVTSSSHRRTESSSSSSNSKAKGSKSNIGLKKGFFTSMRKKRGPVSSSHHASASGKSEPHYSSL
eukprot:CAMPEP_0119552320 /NCGR_PEP_ID=MMETSP1352-20130426/5354_1 /TAXON_ID=265584 /ORGANISM="Stauroneis constricta, Strain CCMP1120" /LENGTH=1701 /DNA_ID=CAMNT_0007598543 /DNA_START=457 /DNA_END=5562 /DNA_ORIENTATION=+